jgi:hypothetical protein
MKLPSITSLIEKASHTFKRFPLAILIAMIGSIFGCLITHLDNNKIETHQWYTNMVMSCYLGMLLLVAIAAFLERQSFGIALKIIIQTIGIAITVAYFYSLPTNWKDALVGFHAMRFALYSFGLHFLIAIAPFIATKEINAFWQYNKVIFLRILTSLLYSGVLYAGLSLALLAIDKLLSVNINYRLYIYLWIVLSGIFNTWFFLAGFPSDYNQLEQSDDYPKGLKVFTQYILLPIITIYLLILYAYMSKIIITHKWPFGWVSYLVLYFSVGGILSLLLIYPIRLLASNKWILTYSRFFYYAIFPLIILLFFAIERRISDYGITELRYFVILLALWLLFIASYFSISKNKNIKLIPQSLCLIAFLSSFGPWGVFNVSLRSQENRFISILSKNNLLVNGKVIKATKQPSFGERKRLSSVVSYIVSNHGYKVLQPYYSQNLDSLVKKDSLTYTYDKEKKILSVLNIDYVNDYETEVETNKFDYSLLNQNTQNNLIETKGFDYLIDGYSFNNYSEEKKIDTTEFSPSNKIIKVCFNQNTNILNIYLDKKGGKTIFFNLSEFLKTLQRSQSADNPNRFTEQQMTLTGNSDKTICKIVVTSVSGKKETNQMDITSLQANILVSNL